MFYRLWIIAFCGKTYKSKDAGKIKKRYHGEGLLKLMNRPIQWFNKTVFYATLDSNFSLDQAIISFLQRNETVWFLYSWFHLRRFDHFKDMVTNFHSKRFAGSLQWRAPEYAQVSKYYFKKPPNYWCNDCMSSDSDRGFNSSGGYISGRSSGHSSRTTNQTSRDVTKGFDLGHHTNFSFKCINCKEKVIFDYYKKADIYAVGLARFSNIGNLRRLVCVG